MKGKISVKWPTLDILMVDGVPIAYKGDLTAFSIGRDVDISIIEMSDPELIVESNDKDYIKLDSIESLLSLIKEVVVTEGVVLEGILFPVIHLFEPGSVAVDDKKWGSDLLVVDTPVLTLKDLLMADTMAYNIVSVTDRWVLDIVICNKVVIGASLSMPEQVEPITGADAFNYPIESPGKWIVTHAKPLSCPPINFKIDRRIVEKAKNVVTGVVKA
ncbi:hypothetical protein IPA_09625 [Ignicoccus pacificus DSM 13166]|uniref:Uncharacterized protein n=1 Tax=Ignicoccus pacificus DSM 13166 TaxID=940294 RepID=A0A977PLC9_9CREN|nr:hypothetical protein IPA_09625 [Ignicoccus pacificus DSM 13166]